jgi:hypothetical protein
MVIPPRTAEMNRFASPLSPALSKFGTDILKIVNAIIKATISPMLFKGYQ